MPRTHLFIRFATLCISVALLCTGGAKAQSSEMSFDRLFTWYELESHSSSNNGRPVDDGYSIKAVYRMLGGAPSGSYFRIELRRGRRLLGQWRCSTNARHGDSPSVHTPFCHDRDQLFKQVGALEVSVYFGNGQTDEETLQTRDHIVVSKVTRVRSATERDAPRYHVEYATEAQFGILERADASSSFIPNARTYSFNRLALVFVTKRAADMPRLHNSVLRCSVDGARVGTMPVNVGQLNTAAATETRMRGSTMVRRDHRYVRFRLGLPIAWGDGLEHRNDIMPLRAGQWSCEWRHEGQALRSFQFHVGSDLQLLPHASANLGLRLPQPLTLVELTIPRRAAIDAEDLDVRVGRGTAFWGQSIGGQRVGGQ